MFSEIVSSLSSTIWNNTAWPGASRSLVSFRKLYQVYNICYQCRDAIAIISLTNTGQNTIEANRVSLKIYSITCDYLESSLKSIHNDKRQACESRARASPDGHRSWAYKHFEKKEQEKVTWPRSGGAFLVAWPTW